MRKTFVCDEEGNGVVPLTVAPQSEAETLAGAVLNEQQRTGLKYPVPNPKLLRRALLTDRMMLMLEELVDETRMSDDLREVWEEVKQNNGKFAENVAAAGGAETAAERASGTVAQDDISVDELDDGTSLAI